MLLLKLKIKNIWLILLSHFILHSFASMLHAAAKCSCHICIMRLKCVFFVKFEKYGTLSKYFLKITNDKSHDNY